MNNAPGPLEIMGQGWMVFRRDMGQLIVLFLIGLVAFFALSYIPIVGALSLFWAPPLMGGLLYAILDAFNGEPVSPSRIMDGFKIRPLTFIGIYFAVSMLGAIMAAILVYMMVDMEQLERWKEFFAQLERMGNSKDDDSFPSLPPMRGLVMMVGGLSLIVAYWQWFMMMALALAAGKDLNAGEAMGGAFAILASSPISALVIPPVMGMAFVISLIPFGLGLLVYLPWFYCVAMAHVGVTAGQPAEASLTPPPIGASGVEAPVAQPSAARSGACLHCFVFEEGGEMNNNKAWDYMEAEASKILDDNPDMEVTGHPLGHWPGSNDEFKKTLSSEINRYCSIIPSAPDYLDNSRFKVKVKTAKNPATGQRMALAFIVVL
ncbi:MAG: hypothetical protein OEV92_10135 [Nitrospinota bacterium]|nr:hypothetical protein [Nitrospinota bacterium]